MTKCEYCGEEIGLLAVRFTWIDKKSNRAIHDKCLEKYRKENPEDEILQEERKIIETKEKTTEHEFNYKESSKREEGKYNETRNEQLRQKDYTEPTGKLIKTKIFGIVILMFALSVTALLIYTEITIGIGFTSISFIILILSYFTGIELVRIKKTGTYHKLIVIIGIILLALYIWLILISMVLSYY